MPKKTERYQLHQYEPQDSFLRTDFNEDNAKIDAALAGKADLALVAEKCRLQTGSYTGDGQPSRFIPLDFTPRAVLVLPAVGNFFASGSSSYTSGGLAVEGSPASRGEGRPLVSILENGFEVYFIRDYVGTNYPNQSQHFLALR